MNGELYILWPGFAIMRNFTCLIVVICVWIEIVILNWIELDWYEDVREIFLIKLTKKKNTSREISRESSI